MKNKITFCDKALTEEGEFILPETDDIAFGKRIKELEDAFEPIREQLEKKINTLIKSTEQKYGIQVLSSTLYDKIELKILVNLVTVTI